MKRLSFDADEKVMSDIVRVFFPCSSMQDFFWGCSVPSYMFFHFCHRKRSEAEKIEITRRDAY